MFGKRIGNLLSRKKKFVLRLSRYQDVIQVIEAKNKEEALAKAAVAIANLPQTRPDIVPKARRAKHFILEDMSTFERTKLENPFLEEEEAPRASPNPNNMLEQTQALIMRMFQYFDKGIDFGLNLGMKISEKVLDKTIDNIVSMQQKAGLARLVGEALGAALRSGGRKEEKVEIREKQGETK